MIDNEYSCSGSSELGESNFFTGNLQYLEDLAGNSNDLFKFHCICLILSAGEYVQKKRRLVSC